MTALEFYAGIIKEFPHLPANESWLCAERSLEHWKGKGHQIDASAIPTAVKAWARHHYDRDALNQILSFWRTGQGPRPVLSKKITLRSGQSWTEKPMAYAGSIWRINDDVNVHPFVTDLPAWELVSLIEYSHGCGEVEWKGKRFRVRFSRLMPPYWPFTISP